MTQIWLPNKNNIGELQLSVTTTSLRSKVEEGFQAKCDCLITVVCTAVVTGYPDGSSFLHT